MSFWITIRSRFSWWTHYAIWQVIRSPHTSLGQYLISELTSVLFVILRRVNSSHPSRKRYNLVWWFQMGEGLVQPGTWSGVRLLWKVRIPWFWTSSLIPRVWKLEVFSTPQIRKLVSIRGSIKENLLLSRFRKSHQLLLITQMENLHDSGSMESTKDLANAPRSSPRSPTSIPPPYLNNTQVKLFVNCFFRWSHWAFSTPFCLSPPSFKIPGFLIIKSQVSDIPGILSRTNCLYTSVLSTPSPRPRTSSCRRCTLPFKNSRLPSTHKIKLLTIPVTSRAFSVLHVIGSQHNPLSADCSQDWQWLYTVLCQVSFDLSPSTRLNSVHIPTKDLHPVPRKDFHVYSGEF